MVIATPNLNLQKPENADDAGQYLNGTIAGGGLHATLDTLDAAVLLTAAQTLTNKTLVTPAIASFTNAQHTHANAAGGGALGAGVTLTNPIISGAVQGTLSTTGDITIEEVTAGLNLFSSGLALNEKRWTHNIETNNLVFRAVSDDSLSSAAWMAVNRTGIVINRVDIQAPALRISDGGSAAATGRIRLENNQFINWRNVSNAGDIGFRMNASDQWELSTVGAANSANAGAAAALPSNPAGYWQMMHNGTPVKIPLYQV